MADDQAAEVCELQDGKVPDWCPARTNRRITDMQVQDLRNDIGRLNEKLDPVIEIWTDFAGLGRMVRRFGSVVMWCVKVGAAVGLAWAAFVAFFSKTVEAAATFIGKGWP